MIRNIWIWIYLRIYFVTNRYFIIYFLFFRQLSIGRPWCYPSCSTSHLFWFTIVFASHVLVYKIPIGSYTIQWERLNFGWSFWYHAYSHFYQGMHVLFYLLFKLGYNYLNFMLHKPKKFVKIKSLWSSFVCTEDQMSYSLMNIRQIHVFFN